MLNSLIVVIRTGCIVIGPLILFFTTQCFSEPPFANENKEAPAEASIEAYMQWSVDYLSVYHSDFKTLGYQPISESQNHFHLLDSTQRVLKTGCIHPEGSRQRQVFESIAALMLDTATSPVSKRVLDALKTAWYWDAQARANPAIFDQMAKAYRSTDGTLSEEADIFWKYRLLIQKAGGRRPLWSAIRKSPRLVDFIEPTTTLETDDLLFLFETMDHKSSPVMDLETSAQWLLNMSQFPFLTNTASDQIPVIKKISIQDLPPRALQNDAFQHELNQRVDWIKRQLPRFNPLYFNVFQSLGVCYEQLINADLSGYPITLERYLKDEQFVHEIQACIDTHK